MTGRLTGLMELDNMEFNDCRHDDAVTQYDKQDDNIIDQVKAFGEAEENEEFYELPTNVTNKQALLQWTGLGGDMLSVSQICQRTNLKPLFIQKCNRKNFVLIYKANN